MTTGLLSDMERRLSSTLGVMAGNLGIVVYYLRNARFDPETRDEEMDRLARRVNECADAYEACGYAGRNPVERIRWDRSLCSFRAYECALCTSPADPDLDDVAGSSGLCRSCALARHADAMDEARDHYPTL